MDTTTAPAIASSLGQVLPPANTLQGHRSRYLLASVLPALCELRDAGRLPSNQPLRQAVSLCTLRAMASDVQLSSSAQAGVKRYLDSLPGWNCSAQVPGLWEQVSRAHAAATQLF